VVPSGRGFKIAFQQHFVICCTSSRTAQQSGNQNPQGLRLELGAFPTIPLATHIPIPIPMASSILILIFIGIDNGIGIGIGIFTKSASIACRMLFTFVLPLGFCLYFF